MTKKKIPFYRCNDITFKYVGDGKYTIISPIKIYPCHSLLKEKELQTILKMFEPYVFIETKEE